MSNFYAEADSENTYTENACADNAVASYANDYDNTDANSENLNNTNFEINLPIIDITNIFKNIYNFVNLITQ